MWSPFQQNQIEVKKTFDHHIAISTTPDWSREDLWSPFQQLQIEKDNTFDRHSDKLQIEVEKPLGCK